MNSGVWFAPHSDQAPARGNARQRGLLTLAKYLYQTYASFSGPLTRGGSMQPLPYNRSSDIPLLMCREERRGGRQGILS